MTTYNRRAAMAEDEPDKIVAFDTLFTTNHIQMLKILLTYVEPAMQRNMAVYIKFLELQYTISFFKSCSSSVLPGFPSENTFNISKLCDELLPLCGHDGQEQLRQMKNMYQNYENMQEILQMMQMMKDMLPEGETSIGTDPSALFSALAGMPDMSGMDMSQLFELFQGMQT